MASDINNQADVLRHTVIRVGIACFLSLLITPFILAVQFGVEPASLVTVASVFKCGLVTAVLVSAVLTSGLTYRSAILMRDLTIARKELFRLSRTDKLTGLLNRRGFDELAKVALRSKGNAGVLMCDIDNFKGVNDRFGHDFGDHVLVIVANIFRSFAEEELAVVARHGGEEFVLLLTATAARSIQLEAERLRRRCEIQVLSGGIPVSITVSIGFASSVEIDDVHQLMQTADEALFRAKRNGRNCVAGARLRDRTKAA